MSCSVSMISMPNPWSHVVMSQSCLCLAYIMMLLVMWSEQWFMAGCLVTDELERMWKETLWHNLTHCGRVMQICVFNTVKLGTSASSP
jgi:hypothetical protein